MTQNTKVLSKGSFEANWEGSYCVDKSVELGAYRLLHMAGTIVKHP